MAKQQLLGEVKKLITIGKEKGFLTYDELNNTLPAEMVSSEQLSNLMNIFGEMDIEIIDSAEGERYQKTPESSEEAEESEGGEEAEAEEKEIDLTPGALSRTDDPVRLYLKEMGSVALLSREGEIEIAKRIEEGKREVASIVFGMPMTLEYIPRCATSSRRARSMSARSSPPMRRNSRRVRPRRSGTTPSCASVPSRP
jgi:RNA polymerase primary sigma factor